MWKKNEIEELEKTDELRIAPEKADGTLQKPVIIWVVRVGDEVFVRSYKGRGSVWFGNALRTGRGEILTGKMRNRVLLQEVGPDEPVQSEIDPAFASKYGRYGRSYVESITGPVSKSATIRIVPA